MSWQCIELTIAADKEHYFSELFDAFAALSVTTTAADETLVFEIDGQAKDNWQLIKLTGMFAADANLNPFIDQLAAHKDIKVKKTQLQDCDWENTWLENFKPQKITENLWICPSWLDPVEPTAITITIDPGMSFGTGTHQSTRLCLSWLSELDLDLATVIDYGCGTGILAITAIKLGADHVLATDIEPRSLASCLENADKNNVSHALKTYLPEEMPEIQTDLVIANILAGTIIKLRQVLSAHTKVNGLLLLAGILRTQEASVRQALSEFDWQSRYSDEWVAMLGKKRH